MIKKNKQKVNSQVEKVLIEYGVVTETQVKETKEKRNKAKKINKLNKLNKKSTKI